MSRLAWSRAHGGVWSGTQASVPGLWLRAMEMMDGTFLPITSEDKAALIGWAEGRARPTVEAAQDAAEALAVEFLNARRERDEEALACLRGKVP